MKKIYTLILSIFLVNAGYSQVAIEWQKSYGGSFTDDTKRIIKTYDGNYLILGNSLSTNGDFNLSNGDRDIWLVKVDPLGNILWKKNYGGSDSDEGLNLYQLPDSGFIVLGGSMSDDGDLTSNSGNYDAWLFKTDVWGNVVWQKNYGGNYNEWFNNLLFTNDGGYIIGGSNSSVPGGYHKYWMVKTDSLGNIQWQHYYGGGSQDYLSKIIKTTDSGFMLFGSTFSNNGQISINYGNYDFWVVKTDSLGNFQWQKSYGGLETESIYDVEQVNNGYIICGRTASSNNDISYNHGQEDIWIIKIDNAGNLIWETTYGGSSYDSPGQMIKLSDGNFIITGLTQSTDGDITNSHGGVDSWLLKIDLNGNLIWQQNFGGSNSESFISVIERSDSSLVVAGVSQSNDIDLSINNGWNDFWILKLTERYNLVTGKIFCDINLNNQHDSIENTINNAMIFTNNNYSFSKNNGTYYLPLLDTGSFFISVASIPYYWPNPVSHLSNFSSLNLVDSLNDFALQPLGNVQDLSVTITPTTPFRPGFYAGYQVNYYNKGTVPMSGNIIFYPANYLTFNGSSITPSQFTLDSIVWNLPVLQPYYSGKILLMVNCSPSAPLGTIVNSGVKIEPLAGDAYPGNNQAWWEVEVTGSYDPNDILVNRNSILSTELANPPYLEYLIRFQNTGTDTTFTVKVMNNITEMLDVSTFEFINSSHPMEISYGNHSRLFEFKFENILLPDSNTNELLSHGFVRYRIKPFDTLSVGDLIENTAAIYFDFNAPVITNTAVTEIVLPVSVPQIKNEFNFSLYPNPTTGELNISFNLEKSADIKLELFNSLGQMLKTISHKKLNAGEKKFNFSTENIPPGIYHLQFSVDGNKLTRKVVKL